MKSADGRKNTTLLRHESDIFTMTSKFRTDPKSRVFCLSLRSSVKASVPVKTGLLTWWRIMMFLSHTVHNIILEDFPIISQNQNPEPSKESRKHHPQSNNKTTKKYQNVQADFYFPQKALQSQRIRSSIPRKASRYDAFRRARMPRINHLLGRRRTSHHDQRSRKASTDPTAILRPNEVQIIPSTIEHVEIRKDQ